AAELRKAPPPAAAPVQRPAAPPTAPPAAPPAAPPRAAAPANRATVENKAAAADAAMPAVPAAPAHRAAREGQVAQEAATLEALAAARGAAQSTARGAVRRTESGAAGPTAPSPAVASVGAADSNADAAADPLARVVGEVAGPGSPLSAQAWWHALRRATAGRWVAVPKADAAAVPTPKAEAAPTPAPDDADAVRAPGGALLGWLRFDGDGVTWQAATPGEPIDPWRAPVADPELRRQLQASRPR
ncbi:MAG: hypothetical protein ABI696_17575, partial [Rubrivivax sp.]